MEGRIYAVARQQFESKNFRRQLGCKTNMPALSGGQSRKVQHYTPSKMRDYGHLSATRVGVGLL